MRVSVVIGCWVALMVTACAGVRQLPSTAHDTSQVGERTRVSADFYTMPHGRLHRNDQGIWELYVSGDPLERGVTNGMLTKELLDQQEAAFVSQIRELVPSRFRQWLLRGFLKFFNRRLTHYVPAEYQTEIYGLSRSASDAYNFLAPPYQRLLYFHGAHDIGHALRDLALVGCTSFAAWGAHTADGKLLIGRNFDFYVGDAFSEEKIVSFIRPDQGYKHAMVTWAGMVGAVSGMNEKGLTVTINAGKSDIPYKAKTPISLLTREILQYAATIDEAIHIAQQREVFVSESIMVGSAADRKAVLIEVSPKKFGVYEVENNADLLICANHFQSQPYLSDKKNLKQLEESHSAYRFERMNELIASAPPLTPALAASALRNREGINGVRLGYGNEKAINQLLAHHAVIFQPEDRLLWVSANPYQLGMFVAYDLKTVFSRMDTLSTALPVDEARLRIPEDPFVHTDTFENYERFRHQTRTLEAAMESGEQIDDTVLTGFIARNPDFWKGYFLVGEYYKKNGRYEEALRYFRMALGKEVTTEPDRRLIEKRIKQCERK
ncbi:C45 family autoproteolytic acyltransferase/hydolase [Parapedobacter defluvii]|nr:C45 family autoproteolytic acyltransferase/hydolase [Parapedobacter defluvii]